MRPRTISSRSWPGSVKRKTIAWPGGRSVVVATRIPPPLKSSAVPPSTSSYPGKITVVGKSALTRKMFALGGLSAIRAHEVYLLLRDAPVAFQNLLIYERARCKECAKKRVLRDRPALQIDLERRS